MAKSKSILISGTPFVQIREKGEDKFSLRLVYKIGDVYEEDEEGNKKRRQQWKYEKLELWLWNKKHLSPIEAEHNRQAKEEARIVREKREREFRTKTHGYVLTSSMRHPNQKSLLEGSKSGLIARCFSVRKSVLVK